MQQQPANSSPRTRSGGRREFFQGCQGRPRLFQSPDLFSCPLPTMRAVHNPINHTSSADRYQWRDLGYVDSHIPAGTYLTVCAIPRSLSLPHGCVRVSAPARARAFRDIDSLIPVISRICMEKTKEENVPMLGLPKRTLLCTYIHIHIYYWTHTSSRHECGPIRMGSQ